MVPLRAGTAPVPSTARSCCGLTLGKTHLPCSQATSHTGSKCSLSKTLLVLTHPLTPWALGSLSPGPFPGLGVCFHSGFPRCCTRAHEPFVQNMNRQVHWSPTFYALPAQLPLYPFIFPGFFLLQTPLIFLFPYLAEC